MARRARRRRRSGVGEADGKVMDPTVFLQSLVSGLMQGGIYSLICVGLTLTFGVMRIVNFAHGEFLMVAMYATYVLVNQLGFHPYLSVLIVLPALFFFGLFIYRVAVSKVIRAPQANQMILMVGVSLILQNAVLLIFSANYYTISPSFGEGEIHAGQVVIRMPHLIASVISLAVTLVLYQVLRKTDMGRSIRAAAQNPEAAALLGVNVPRTYMIAFGIGVGCLGVAGPLLMPIYYVAPHLGTFFILIAFVVVVLGGIGDFIGALVASIIIGIAESMGAVVMPGSTAPVLVFLIFILVLLFRPQGLLVPRRGRA